MLYLSSTITDRDLVKGAVHVIQTRSESAFSVFKLFDIMPSGAFPVSFRISCVNRLIKASRLDQAMALLVSVDWSTIRECELKGLDLTSFMAAVPCMAERDDFPMLLGLFSKAHGLDDDHRIRFTLDVSSRLIMEGMRACAETILRGISPAHVANDDHLADLGLQFIQVSRFDEADTIFKMAGERQKKHPPLAVYEAVNTMCRGDHDAALSLLDSLAVSGNDAPLILCWKAKMLNYAGHHHDALVWAQRALEYTTTGRPVQRCYCLVECGNSLRSLGKTEDALVCYEKAMEKEMGAVFWLWIACFEKAMALTALGRPADALRAAEKGCSYVSPRFNTIFNPCTVMRRFLDHRLGRDADLPFNEQIDQVRLWPWPYYPYNLWMLILIGIIREEQGGEDVMNLLDPDVECPVFARTVKRKSSGQRACGTGRIHSEDILFSRLWLHDDNINVLRDILSGRTLGPGGLFSLGCDASTQ
ncbi:hypothetical protein JCM14469_05320 [Desulfatiferula olefinivorans]